MYLAHVHCFEKLFCFGPVHVLDMDALLDDDNRDLLGGLHRVYQAASY